MLTINFQVSYCDGNRYANKVDLVPHNPFFSLISDIVKFGITSSSYSKRAELITSRMNIQLQPLEYNLKLAVCDTTAGHDVEPMVEEFPIAKDFRTCSNKNCVRVKEGERNIMFISLLHFISISLI